jgi:O-antigen/teichoic acid export membrane protein
MPLAAVTFYTLPFSISEKASIGVSNITSVVFPFTSELHSMGAHDKVHELYLRSTKILMLVTLPITVILVTVPGPILRFWLGPEYAVQGTVALSLLGVATFVNAASAVATVSSLGVGRAWMPAAFAFASSIISLVGNFVLIPRYGINGAAFAALLPQALVVPGFVYMVTRMLKFSLWQLILRGFLRPVLCATAQAAILFGLRRYVGSLVSLALVCMLSLSVYGVLSYFGAITKDERKALFRGPSLAVNEG